jgi:predicted CXXCH cytochrome family protein
MRRTIGFKRFAVLLLCGAAVLLSAAALGGVTPGSKAAGMEACVAPTDDMRRNHMEYLKHERVEVVRDGVRDTKYSLAECVNCHGTHDEQGQPVAINSEGQFCDGCHNYTAVSITCFQCHSKVPEEK